jgi:hypothetical protein
MSRFGGTDYILVLHDVGSKGHIGGDDKPKVSWRSKQLITVSANHYALAKKIPLSQRFSTRPGETTSPGFQRFYFDSEEGVISNPGIFSPLTKISLTPVDEKDKLFIFGHGNRVGIAWMADYSLTESGRSAPSNALALAEYLHAHGLRKVGLITFKACLVAKNDFLQNFALALGVCGIEAGWIKGYKGFSDTFRPEIDKAKEFVSSDKEGNNELTNPDLSKATGKDLVNNERYRIVRGPGRLFEGQTFGKGGRFIGSGGPTEKEIADFARNYR